MATRDGGKGAVAAKRPKEGAADSGASKAEAKATTASLSLVETKALKWIVDFLSAPENRHQLLYCKGQLEAGLCDSNSGTRDVEQRQVFHHTYTTFKSLPKYFIAESLVQVCGLTKEAGRSD